MFSLSWKTVFKQSRHLLNTWLSVEPLSYFLSQFRHFLDTCIYRRPNPWHLAQHLVRHLLTLSSVEIYWTSIYRFYAIWFSFLSISLLIASSFHLSNLSHSLQTSSSRFLQDFKSFSSLGMFLISHLHAFHVLKSRFWGIFKIDELLLKFWDGFLLKWV